ncbi:MAG: flagellar export chaperone FliS [Proteobacteria bacterium]|nr:flagellar export chaperone FliS [Pseudomonadota bacterium]
MSSGNYRTATDAYRGVGVGSVVDSATPHQLIRMLFAGASAAVAAAKGYMERGEIGPKCEAISKAIDIIDGGLKVSLDRKVCGEMAQNLYDLYVYMTQRLVVANVKNDAAALGEVAKLLQQLGGAWEAIAVKQAGAKPTGAAPGATPAAASPLQARTTHKIPAPSPAQANSAATGSAGQASAPADIGASNTNETAAQNPTSQQSRLAAAYGAR